MNAPKRVRRIQSLTSNTNVYMVMGGLAPRTGIPTATRSHQQLHSTNKQTIPQPGVVGQAALQYMQNRSLLSSNPACSGGVGRRARPCKLSFRR